MSFCVSDNLSMKVPLPQLVDHGEVRPSAFPNPEMLLGRIASAGTASGGTMPATADDIAAVDDGAFGSFNNVVRIFVTRQSPDYGNPWMTTGITNSSGSGVVLKTHDGSLRILTAAHVVADQTFLQVQKSGIQNPNKYSASVHAICHDCDLALLTVATNAGDDFWDGLQPAAIGEIPLLRSVVLVAGFPVGGEQLSITEGVVSRIEGQLYSQSNRSLLALTSDAAINAGNSGGPVFNLFGELVGIAFQVLNYCGGNGHIIPPPILRHFLDGIAKYGPKGYQGLPMFGLECQELTNGHLRNHFNLDKQAHGVLVNKVVHLSSCDGVVQEHDILTHIDGLEVANNETVAYEGCGRVKVPIVFDLNQCGDKVKLGIIRKGEKMLVEVVAKPEKTLVAKSGHDRWPKYFIYCGLVFQRLSVKFIDRQTPGFPHYERLVNNDKLMSKDWREVCILSRILSDEVNVGYGDLRLEQIKKVNGENVPDFSSLVKMIEEADSPYITLQTCCGELIILPSPSNPEAKTANERIMKQYHIGNDRRV